ncbi:MAG: transporter substrate-binding domain-containing protein [Bdellovibrionales bacterium]|nr:transporter substrate-binding domain-containing protein [Bdellovibrionales bacterium]
MKALLLFLTTIMLLPAAPAAESIHISLAAQESFVALPVIIDLKEFITNALKKENIVVTFVPLPVTRGTSLADKGELDGEMIRDKESIEGFSNLITSTHPLAVVHFKAVYLKSNTKFKHENMKDFRCGTLLNNRQVQAKLEADKIKCLEFKSPMQTFQLVKAGRIDYVLLANEIIDGFFERNPSWKEIYVIDEKPYTDMRLYLVLNKKRADLIPVIEKALRAAIKSELPKYKRLQQGINKNF